MAPERKALLQIHFCVLLWGFTAILGKLISLPALQLVWWRMLVVVAVLLAWPPMWRELRAAGGRTLAVFAGIGVVVMPAMAAVLIVAGFQSIKRERIADVWDTGWSPRIVMAVTLALTLAIPLQQAVFLGVLLSILAYFFIHGCTRSAADSAHPQPRRHGDRRTRAV